MEVIPALNCHEKDFECIAGKVRTAEHLGAWVHLDVADGRFTYNKTWGNAGDWGRLKTNLQLEVHLMVEEPEKTAGDWLRAGAKRIIVHIETLMPETADKIIFEAKTHGAEVMLALSPETRIDKIASYASKFSAFQILAVHPGLPAQSFQPLVLEKVKYLRSSMPATKIEVDGGINKETAKLAKHAGADILISASYIFESGNAQAAYETLLTY